MLPSSPVLALHGWLGRGEDWLPVERALGRRLLAPDMPGHGAASGVGAESMDDAADFVLRALDVRGIARAVVAGYSLGGRLALHLALRDPGRVAGLVLVSASAGLPTEAERSARRAADAERAARLVADPRSFLRDWYASPLFDPLSASARAALAADRLGHGDPGAWARALVALSVGAQPWLGGRLAEVPAPAVAIAGAVDRKFSDIARAMSRAGGFEPRVLAGAGHALLVERPEAVAAAIAEVAGRAEGRVAADQRLPPG